MERPLLELLDRRAVVLDGGAGAIQGAASGRLLFGEPERVEELHRRFLAAGSDAVETMSFTLDARSVARAGETRSAFELSRRAAELARATAERASTAERPRYVLGSVGPGWDSPSRGEVGEDELRASYSPQLEGLVAGGVDALLVETVRDPLQARAALGAALEAGVELPLLVSFSPEPDGRLAAGARITEAVELLAPFPVALFALNCGGGPAALWPALEELASTSAPRLGFYPNAGLPGADGAHPVGPEELARWLGRAVEELGVTLIGGCCGAGPEHVAAIARAAGGWSRGARPRSGS